MLLFDSSAVSNGTKKFYYKYKGIPWKTKRANQ